jgi:hypothetical protein
MKVALMWSAPTSTLAPALIFFKRCARLGPVTALDARPAAL